jgi:glycosyltransferase involved in cell wall biosynthesis
MSAFEIAVIIPNHQRGESLLRACRSVLEQSCKATEVVVVDDASTTDLLSIRENLESSGINWLRMPENSGPAAARNAGVAATSSPWVAFLDSDDWWKEEKLASQVGWHQENPESRISQVTEEWVRNGKPIHKPSHWEPGEGDLFADSVERCSIGPSCVMLHRSLWEIVGGFDPRYRVCEDYALWLEIARQERVGKVPGEALVVKEGGRSDQLSRITPAMDRYRVAALLELLERDELNEEQRRLAENGLVEKCRVLEKGARKRNELERAERYRQIAESVSVEGESSRISRSIEEAWAEIVGPGAL